MIGTSKKSISILILDSIIFLLCLFGIYRLSEKAFLPFNFKIDNSYIVITEVTEALQNIAVGDTIVNIDNISFKHREELELYTDTKNINDTVNIFLLNNNKVVTSSIRLVNYYSLIEIIIIAFVGVLFVILPLFVLLKSEDKSSIYFHWANIGLAMVITMSAANQNVGPRIISNLVHILFLFSFALTPVLFMHFVSAFTGRIFKYYRIVIGIFYTLAIIIAGMLSYLFLQYIQTKVFEFIQQYVELYAYVFRIFLIASIVTILVLFYYAYNKIDDYVTKRKLNWLIIGFLIGPLAFMLFWVIPFFLYGHPFMSEGLMHILLISFPVSITIAIVKYQMLDVDLILNRSVVYALVLLGLIAIYLLLFMFFTDIVKGIDDRIPAVIAAVFVAFLLQPAKRKVQTFVDRRFFRVRYNYREEQKKFLEDIKGSYGIESLSKKIVEHADVLIPVEKIGFFIVKKPENRIRILANRGFEILEGRSVQFEEEKLKTDLPFPVAVDNKVEQGVTIESADREVFKRWGMALVFPIKSPSGEIHGFLVLGSKKSGTKYFQEDIDLLNTVALTCAITLDRIKLQEQLILERLESERLDELNKTKSLFVSTVSHDLKAPLTSIILFAQLLDKELELKSDKTKDCLEIIEGEGNRLRRQIENVLDFAKIEEGLKQYNFNYLSFNQLTKNVLLLMEYQFKMAKIKLVKYLSNDEITIKADEDAVEQAMINLLSNAIKYSASGTKVTVSTGKLNDFAFFKVEDQGVGISQQDKKRIFEPFFRTAGKKSIKAEGTGLGLAIIKNIIDAHSGRIEMMSTPGKGSTFSLFFPREG